LLFRLFSSLAGRLVGPPAPGISLFPGLLNFSLTSVRAELRFAPQTESVLALVSRRATQEGVLCQRIVAQQDTRGSAHPSVNPIDGKPCPLRRIPPKTQSTIDGKAD
jgi:hypothetical protein